MSNRNLVDSTRVMHTAMVKTTQDVDYAHFGDDAILHAGKRTVLEMLRFTPKSVLRDPNKKPEVVKPNQKPDAAKLNQKPDAPKAGAPKDDEDMEPVAMFDEEVSLKGKAARPVGDSIKHPTPGPGAVPVLAAPPAPAVNEPKAVAETQVIKPVDVVAQPSAADATSSNSVLCKRVGKGRPQKADQFFSLSSRYVPNDPRQLFNNDRAYAALTQWLKRRKEHDKTEPRVAFLHGNVGSGKTCAIRMAMEKANYVIREINPEMMTVKSTVGWFW